MPSKSLGLVGLLWLSQAAIASDEPQVWLETMTQALREQNYQANLVYSQDQHLSSMKLQHGVAQSKERERLVYLDGAERELIRNGDDLTQTGPEGRGPFSGRFKVSSPFLGQLTQDWPTLSRSYRVKLGDSERIADRQARRLDIQPRDNLRYGYQLWLDEQSKLPLHSRIVDAQGKILEQFLVVGLEWPWTPDNSFWPADAVVTAEPSSAAPVAANWILGWLPDGFTLERVSHKVNKRGQVEHQLYGDGLASLSVYIEAKNNLALAGANSHSRLMKMGATSVLDQQRSHLQLTLIGELPPSTLERIATSIQPAAASTGPQISQP